MNSQEIENLMRSDCELSTTFEGVFPSDCIPAFCDSRTAIVLNLDPQTQNGSHWVAMYLENGKGEYFCSYGSSPKIDHFINFLNRNCNKGWNFNKDDLQSLNSDVCGDYCMWYLSERVRGKSMHEIVSNFSNNTRSNDERVKDLVETRFGRIADKIINVNNCRYCIQCCIKRTH
jgi:hypothetical protein